ncbi:MAG: 3-phosphoserine/phosphohydroxythreonine transaminase [Rhodothermaceae bacterium]|nr:3-phosphoserine/phosphohydroxythreonine transaminase [Rhodothermaceae bacterium]MXZ57599.1 3-phosphoserine/phosphohydroxythreonine transaminase [Rhodothermaceae bacterium]MYB91259.1 3-phosphoserine/phosphohydroxythreonine transaminase [Rhodothermaceae bacterium]MYD68921.1 3-phosphoserine/phosphohydroxythreonine transaminase [Rhodothermaceae bacterium]MYG45354.1 3-phosphoserine/phosphohydroxythreonine transaminase [Rhodothermaceae bacterium]
MTLTQSRRLHNFSAGPGTLPLSVIEAAREELPVFRNTGASVMEISHRSPAYIEIETSARERIGNLLGLTDDWHVLFLGGGASMQFHQVPLNFLPPDGQAAYLLTGTWAKKAHVEACKIGHGRIAASSAESAFNYIPDPTSWELDSRDSYLHYTSNNTVYGTQFHDTPDVSCPLVCDASSDFLSYPLELDRYGLIYAGAQKNIGPAGVTVVLVRDSFLETRNAGLPTMLNYGTHAAKCFNTPPVYAVYMVEKVLGWLEDQGGIPGIQAVNQKKAALLYDAIDSSGFYRGTAEKESRSRMNVTFRMAKEELEPVFIQQAAGHGLVALKGHRSVGGIRASIYNACPLESVEVLVDFMGDFEKKNG